MITTLLLVGAQLTYVVPPAAEAGRVPIPTALAVSLESFDDVSCSVPFSGNRQLWTRLRYGEADSARVAIAVDIGAPGVANLYVDRNRDLVLGADERVPVTADGELEWELDLPAMIRGADGELEAVPRRLFLRLNGRGTILSAATVGRMEGVVDVAGKSVGVRRLDLDVNGFFGDRADQLWIDLNGDGEWAAFGELHASVPFLRLGKGTEERRYALRSTRAGDSLRLVPSESTGLLDLSLGDGPGGARRDVREMEALLVGRDGSVLQVMEYGQPVEALVGEYRLAFLRFSLAAVPGDDDGRDWTFVFSEAHLPTESSWLSIAQGETARLDPVSAGLSMELAFPEGPDAVASHGKVRCQPYLFLGRDRLLIRDAFRGRSARSTKPKLRSHVSLLGEDGRALASYESTFL